MRLHLLINQNILRLPAKWPVLRTNTTTIRVVLKLLCNFNYLVFQDMLHMLWCTKTVLKWETSQLYSNVLISGWYRFIECARIKSEYGNISSSVSQLGIPTAEYVFISPINCDEHWAVITNKLLTCSNSFDDKNYSKRDWSQQVWEEINLSFYLD